MKKTILLSISILFLTLTQSCGNSSTISTEKVEPVVIENLNLTEDNKKWQANIETTVGINEMLEVLEDFDEIDKLKDYKKLGRKLSNINKGILNQCSMKGESHDNLHAFLIPIFRYLKLLKTTKSLPEATKTVFNFERHLNEYSNYFE